MGSRSFSKCDNHVSCRQKSEALIKCGLSRERARRLISFGTKRSYRAAGISGLHHSRRSKKFTRHYRDLLLDQHRSSMLKARETNESVIAVLCRLFFFVISPTKRSLFFSIRLDVCRKRISWRDFHFASKLKLILHDFARVAR